MPAYARPMAMTKWILIFLCSLATGLRAADKPNILWIYVEDLSPWMESYGFEINAGKTPTLDRLSSQGVRFSRCYVPAPVCSACRGRLRRAPATAFGDPPRLGLNQFCLNSESH